jgi:hypothetical protein
MQNPLANQRDAEHQDGRVCSVDPQPARRGIRDLLAGPAEQTSRIDDDRDPGEDLAGKDIDLLRQLAQKRHWRRLLRRCAAALGRDQRAQIGDEAGARRVILQGVQEPLELVDRRRCGVCRRRRCLSRAVGGRIVLTQSSNRKATRYPNRQILSKVLAANARWSILFPLLH